MKNRTKLTKEMIMIFYNNMEDLFLINNLSKIRKKLIFGKKRMVMTGKQ